MHEQKLSHVLPTELAQKKRRLKVLEKQADEPLRTREVWDQQGRKKAPKLFEMNDLFQCVRRVALSPYATTPFPFYIC